METLTVEKIKEAIVNNVREAREKNISVGDETFSTIGFWGRDAGPRKRIEDLLWKYGLRYAREIKKIPVLNRIAEYSYWGIAVRKLSSEPSGPPPAKASRGIYRDGARRR